MFSEDKSKKATYYNLRDLEVAILNSKEEDIIAVWKSVEKEAIDNATLRKSLNDIREGILLSKTYLPERKKLKELVNDTLEIEYSDTHIPQFGKRFFGYE